MRKCFILIFIIFLFLPVQINAETPLQFKKRKVDYPEVPRISAYEAYLKYKEGKAIIMHAGGEAYKGRHILGAFNLEKYNDQLLLKFPKQGTEIFTYCY